MQQNHHKSYANNLSSHASLLLSASPTIITAPFQNNTNNSQGSPIPSAITPTRRQPNTPLLAASNLDNDSHLNIDSPLGNSITEGYINFKKPQNEMFKRLDGKIQKIVAAHSNLNKLYALNDFSSLGVGPKRPFELPPQLPPPPPWVPKVAGEFGNQWNESPNNSLNSPDDATNNELIDLRPDPLMYSSDLVMKAPMKHNSRSNMLTTKSSSPTIESAISKLHQRRQQQEQQKLNLGSDQTVKQPIKEPAPCSSSSSSTNPVPTITSNKFSLIVQQLKEDLRRAPRPQKTTPEERRKFREDLITVLKEEIFAITKSAKLKSVPLNNLKSKPKVAEQQSLLLNSPQTLFNTIRRETSLLLNKRENVGRSSLSLLSDQQTFNRQNLKSIHRQPINKLQTIKVIVPPTEYYPCHRFDSKESTKSKKAKRFHCIGLKLGNYLDRECPQQSTEKITVEQFAKCLNLVRPNDISLQRHQEQLLQSDSKWRIPVGNRPLRLRSVRLRNREKIHMPASASYRATRKVGLH